MRLAELNRWPVSTVAFAQVVVKFSAWAPGLARLAHTSHC